MSTGPTTRLGKRLVAVRHAAGYGGPRQAAKFARKIGITPASLHDLESGKSKDLGGKSLQGYIGVGANPFFILHGKGAPMIKDVAKNLRLQALLTMLLDLEDGEIQTVEDVVRAFIRAKPSGDTPHFHIESNNSDRPPE